MHAVENINWQKVNNLLPVIVQDQTTNEVLMLAYMNQEALELSLSTHYAHYFSRTKQRIWRKGEESGHTQKISSFKLDCDNDTLLISIEQIGVACHTGRKSCFFNNLESKETTKIIKEIKTYSVIDTLYHTLLDRKLANPKSSYTASLFHKGENTILKKIVEESGEFTFAIKDNNTKEIIYEAADLLYHTLVALAYKNISPDLVKQEIKRRFNLSGIAEKNARKE